jgi:23S rRNA (pseudouridine1915-N3)-methyltransferase
VWFNVGVRIKIAWVGKTKEPAIQALTEEYLKRLGRYVATDWHELRSEEALAELVARERARPALVLLDSRGRQLSSEELAELLEAQQERGTPALMFVVGPADGFTDEARRSADLILSLGKMTLPHELARVVLLEQLYRGFTILKGHPYHTGH